MGLQRVCLALPGVEERLNHGMPTFGIVGRPAFANLHTHPDDGRPTLWFKAAPGVQGELVDQEPERFFVPPYVGPRGWVGLRLDVDLDWDEICKTPTKTYPGCFFVSGPPPSLEQGEAFKKFFVGDMGEPWNIPCATCGEWQCAHLGNINKEK